VAPCEAPSHATSSWLQTSYFVAAEELQIKLKDGRISSSTSKKLEKILGNRSLYKELK
jgi:hypothetical protein